MKNGSIILLVVFLSLVLIGLLVWGFVFLPKKQQTTTPATNANGTNTNTNTNTNTGGTTTGGGTTTPTPTPSVSQYLKDLAQEFRTQFQCSSCASNRCTVIGKVNDLTIQNLRIFSAYYNTTFGITPKEEMDDAWVWCAVNSVDDTLYQKLEGL